jgi:hypothetical protein
VSHDGDVASYAAFEMAIANSAIEIATQMMSHTRS